MITNSFAQWYKSTGLLRVSLFSIAIIGKVLFYIFNPPHYISQKALMLPFPFLITLDGMLIVINSIIIVECIRIIAHRLTATWSLRKHFAIVSAFIIAFTIFNLFIVSPKKSNYYYNYGWALAEKKDYSQAISSLNISLQYNPANIAAYIERGYVHRKLCNLELALNDYNKTIELDSKNAKGYKGKGYVYYDLGDSENAIKAFETAIALDPQLSDKLSKWIKAAKNK